jgi:hypothetical protein
VSQHKWDGSGGIAELAANSCLQPGCVRTRLRLSTQASFVVPGVCLDILQSESFELKRSIEAARKRWSPSSRPYSCTFQNPVLISGDVVQVASSGSVSARAVDSAVTLHSGSDIIEYESRKSTLSRDVVAALCTHGAGLLLVSVVVVTHVRCY